MQCTECKTTKAVSAYDLLCDLCRTRITRNCDFYEICKEKFKGCPMTDDSLKPSADKKPNCEGCRYKG